MIVVLDACVLYPPSLRDLLLTLAVVDATHPRHGGSVIEPHDEVHLHRHGAGDALDDTDDVRGLAADRHAVNDPHDPVARVESGLEDERPGDVLIFSVRSS